MELTWIYIGQPRSSNKWLLLITRSCRTMVTTKLSSTAWKPSCKAIACILIRSFSQTVPWTWRISEPNLPRSKQLILSSTAIASSPTWWKATSSYKIWLTRVSTWTSMSASNCWEWEPERRLTRNRMKTKCLRKLWLEHTLVRLSASFTNNTFASLSTNLSKAMDVSCTTWAAAVNSASSRRKSTRPLANCAL